MSVNLYTIIDGMNNSLRERHGMSFSVRAGKTWRGEAIGYVFHDRSTTGIKQVAKLRLASSDAYTFGPVLQFTEYSDDERLIAERERRIISDALLGYYQNA